MEPDQGMLATVVQERDAQAAHEEGTFVVTIVEGPERGVAYRLDGSLPNRVHVGSSPTSEIQVSDPQVSRRHAAFERVGSTLKVLDLASTNGTYVDRVKIIEAELQGGEFVRVGQTVLQIDIAGTGEPAPLTSEAAFGRTVGASREMRRLYPLVSKIANANVPVVIEGETGTGKEALAESIHEMGPRANGPFVVFDCTAVASTLVEAELFGHERGAFTGATSQRKGVFEQAHGGTLLIDEVGDLDLALQPKLLRALERFEIRRVGGDRWIRVDVRVLAATRRDLDREVQAGRFRDDLYHRLAVARIELPPLRNRIGDIGVLARHFWRDLGGDPRLLTAELLRRWDDEPWPGNVRELRNTIARQIALGDLPPPMPPSLSELRAPEGGVDALDAFVDSGLPYPQARDRLLEAFEERFVARVLAAHGGDVARAAAASGIGRRYFQKLKARTHK